MAEMVTDIRVLLWQSLNVSEVLHVTEVLTSLGND